MTVVGLARSGIGAANLLAELGARVTVTDTKTEEELKDFMSGLNPSVRLALGSHPEDIFVRADAVIVSPGVPLGILPLFLAKSKGIPVVGELELAYQVAIYGSDNPPIRPLIKGGFLAVTGTNGKSTTTALLDFMMKKAGFKTILGGNIGNALTGEILRIVATRESHLTPYDFIVAEVSSFQLESIKDFRPKTAAIVNVTPDHLDRYHSLEEYSAAKARIFENQGEDDFLVLNRDDAGTMKLYNSKFSSQRVARGDKIQDSKSRVFYFSRKQEVKGLYYKEGIVYCDLPHLESRPFALIRAEEIKIKGARFVITAANGQLLPRQRRLFPYGLLGR